jgi:hypothetical protein
MYKIGFEEREELLQAKLKEFETNLAKADLY